MGDEAQGKPERCVTWRTAAASVRHEQGLAKIPSEEIESDQENRKHDDPGIPHNTCLFLLFQHVADRGTEKKYLQARQETRRNFHQSKLVNEGNQEDGATGYRGNQAQQDCKNVPTHACFVTLLPRSMVPVRNVLPRRGGL